MIHEYLVSNVLNYIFSPIDYFLLLLIYILKQLQQNELKINIVSMEIKNRNKTEVSEKCLKMFPVLKVGNK